MKPIEIKRDFNFEGALREINFVLIGGGRVIKITAYDGESLFVEIKLKCAFDLVPEKLGHPPSDEEIKRRVDSGRYTEAEAKIVRATAESERAVNRAKIAIAAKGIRYKLAVLHDDRSISELFKIGKNCRQIFVDRQFNVEYANLAFNAALSEIDMTQKIKVISRVIAKT